MVMMSGCLRDVLKIETLGWDDDNILRAPTRDCLLKFTFQLHNFAKFSLQAAVGHRQRGITDKR